jgi:hypothetical protein
MEIKAVRNLLTPKERLKTFDSLDLVVILKNREKSGS